MQALGEREIRKGKPFCLHPFSPSSEDAVPEIDVHQTVRVPPEKLPSKSDVTLFKIPASVVPGVTDCAPAAAALTGPTGRTSVSGERHAGGSSVDWEWRLLPLGKAHPVSAPTETENESETGTETETGRQTGNRVLITQ